jgi:hypothetical protein
VPGRQIPLAPHHIGEHVVRLIEQLDDRRHFAVRVEAFRPILQVQVAGAERGAEDEQADAETQREIAVCRRGVEHAERGRLQIERAEQNRGERAE